MQFRCSALLFDLDGVLVDSRAVVERTCRRWALRHQLDPDEVLRIAHGRRTRDRSEEHTSELQSPCNLVCRLLLEKKKKKSTYRFIAHERSVYIACSLR